MKIFKLMLVAVFVLMTVNLAYAGGDAADGEAKSASCSSCHGSDGKGIDPNPALAGLDESFIVEQLAAFKSGTRESPMMQMFANQLSDQDMADLAAYYSGLSAE